MPTKIEFAHETLNPIRTADGGYHCQRVSPGCDYCYASDFNVRFGNHQPYPSEYRRERFEVRKQPLKWKKGKRIFWQSMSDLFYEDGWINDFSRILNIIRQTPQHLHLLLTKRPQNAKLCFEYFVNNHTGQIITKPPDNSPRRDYQTKGEIPLNFLFGVSIENQEMANLRMPYLSELKSIFGLRIWVNLEPLLGPVDLSPWASTLDWISLGGESGRGARPMHPKWVRDARDFCRSNNIPFFFKQWGAWIPADQCNTEVQAQMVAQGSVKMFPWPDCLDVSLKLGKKHTGRTLDGLTWEQLPNPHWRGLLVSGGGVNENLLPTLPM
jgi:protein gp37